jgi:hypothetical protein
MSKKLIIYIGTLCLLVAAVSFAGSVPRKISYQATVEDSEGGPVTTEIQVIFAIYDNEFTKGQLWAETLLVHPADNGAFSKVLGEVHEIQDTVMDGGVRYMGITVGTDAELTPRTLLTASPYSFRVASLDDATGGVVHGVLTLAPTVPGGDDAALHVQNSSGENAMSMEIGPTDVPFLIARGPGGDDQTEFNSSGMVVSTNIGRGLQEVLRATAEGITIRGEQLDDTLAHLSAATGQLTITDGFNVNWSSAKGGRGDGATEDGTGSSSIGPNDLSTANYSFAVGDGNTGSYVTNVFMVGNDNLIEDDLGDAGVWADGSVAIGDSNIVKGNSSFCVGTNNWLGANRSTVFGRGNNTTGSGQVFVFGDSCITSGTGNSSITGGQRNSILFGGLGVISGGVDNLINSSLYANIAGGVENVIDGDLSWEGGTIGGGSYNRVTAQWSTIAGGHYNEANGPRSTVAGGAANRANGAHSFIGGGQNNRANGDYSTVPGGYSNWADSAYAFAAGYNAMAYHAGSFVWADYQAGQWPTTDTNQFLIRASGGVGINTNSPSQALTVAGTIYSTSGGFKFPDGSVQTSAIPSIADGWTDGGNYVRLTNVNDSVGIGTSSPTEKLDVVGNIAVSGNATIGTGNTNTGIYAFVAGTNNSVTGSASVVSGGHDNSAVATEATIAGGVLNSVTGVQGFVGGGAENSAGYGGAIAGGLSNTTTGNWGAIGGGNGNLASGDWAAISGGGSNVASGRLSFVAGGMSNTASGSVSMAAGFKAKATHKGAFVWADSTDANFNSSAVNEFSVRASGGVRFFTNGALSSGVYMNAGDGAWNTVSDRDKKENFEKIDLPGLLEKLAGIPISTWNYKTQDEAIRHIGPMAQDFHAAFGLGEDDKHISTIDADGVALAGVQALYERIKKLESENEALKQQLGATDTKLTELTALVQSALSEKIGTGSGRLAIGE